MIDPRAAIDSSAEIDENVTIGPFTVIGPNVRIAGGTDIGPHVVINGETSIGRDNRIYQFASIGEEPQDKKYAGEPTRLEIGERNRIREFTTIHRGTAQDNSLTRIGSDNLLILETRIFKTDFFLEFIFRCVLRNQCIPDNKFQFINRLHI